MILSKNFTLNEWAVSSAFPDLAEQITFNSEEIERIFQFTIQILQPMRDYYKNPITITSGKRSYQLQKAIYTSRGKKPFLDSDHLFVPARRSLAVDITSQNADYLWNWLLQNRQLYKYAYYHLSRNFIHVSALDANTIYHQRVWTET
jgi:hypothetical protein